VIFSSFPFFYQEFHLLDNDVAAQVQALFHFSDGKWLPFLLSPFLHNTSLSEMMAIIRFFFSFPFLSFSLLSVAASRGRGRFPAGPHFYSTDLNLMMNISIVNNPPLLFLWKGCETVKGVAFSLFLVPLFRAKRGQAISSRNRPPPPSLPTAMSRL